MGRSPSLRQAIETVDRPRSHRVCRRMLQRVLLLLMMIMVSGNNQRRPDKNTPSQFKLTASILGSHYRSRFHSFGGALENDNDVSHLAYTHVQYTMHYILSIS